jgi:hypothetical protein
VKACSEGLAGQKGLHGQRNVENLVSVFGLNVSSVDLKGYRESCLCDKKTNTKKFVIVKTDMQQPVQHPL